MQSPVPKIYAFLTTLAVSILVGGTVFYHYVEHFSWLDALYFCVVTLAGVGYGDITP
jgi:voltage-gated potassium channel